jgi:hypothetical protein
MSNKSEIALIAESVLANCRILELLIAKLPDATKAEVAKEVAKVNPTPVQVAPQALVVTPAPAPTVAPTTAPVVQPTVVEAPAPIPTPAPAVAPPAAPVMPAPTVGAVPFTDHKGLITYVMNTYREIGAERGKKIQDVLNTLGAPNINDVKPEQYAPLYAEIEKIRTGG